MIHPRSHGKEAFLLHSFRCLIPYPSTLLYSPCEEMVLSLSHSLGDALIALWALFLLSKHGQALVGSQGREWGVLPKAAGI